MFSAEAAYGYLRALLSAARACLNTPGRSTLFNICETFHLYYNGSILVLCREKKIMRQGLAVFCSLMLTSIIMMLALAAPSLFAAEPSAAPVRGETAGQDLKAAIEDLKGADHAAKMRAIARLEHAGGKEAAAALLGRFKAEKNGYARARIAEALRGKRDKDTASALAGLARTGAAPDVRCGAVKALSDSDPATAVPALLEAFRDKKEAPGVRLQAADSLSNYPEDRVFDVLAAALDEPGAMMKRQALVSLYNGFGWDKKRVAPIIKRMAGDPDTKAIAAQYLKNLGAEK